MVREIAMDDNENGPPETATLPSNKNQTQNPQAVELQRKLEEIQKNIDEVGRLEKEWKENTAALKSNVAAHFGAVMTAALGRFYQVNGLIDAETTKFEEVSSDLKNTYNILTRKVAYEATMKGIAKDEELMDGSAVTPEELNARIDYMNISTSVLPDRAEHLMSVMQQARLQVVTAGNTSTIVQEVASLFDGIISTVDDVGNNYTYVPPFQKITLANNKVVMDITEFKEIAGEFCGKSKTPTRPYDFTKAFDSVQAMWRGIDDKNLPKEGVAHLNEYFSDAAQCDNALREIIFELARSMQEKGIQDNDPQTIARILKDRLVFAPTQLFDFKMDKLQSAYWNEYGQSYEHERTKKTDEEICLLLRDSIRSAATSARTKWPADDNGDIKPAPPDDEASTASARASAVHANALAVKALSMEASSANASDPADLALHPHLFVPDNEPGPSSSSSSHNDCDGQEREEEQSPANPAGLVCKRKSAPLLEKRVGWLCKLHKQQEEWDEAFGIRPTTFFPYLLPPTELGGYIWQSVFFHPSLLTRLFALVKHPNLKLKRPADVMALALLMNSTNVKVPEHKEGVGEPARRVLLQKDLSFPKSKKFVLPKVLEPFLFSCPDEGGVFGFRKLSRRSTVTYTTGAYRRKTKSVERRQSDSTKVKEKITNAAQKTEQSLISGDALSIPSGSNEYEKKPKAEDGRFVFRVPADIISGANDIELINQEGTISVHKKNEYEMKDPKEEPLSPAKNPSEPVFKQPKVPQRLTQSASNRLPSASSSMSNAMPMTGASRTKAYFTSAPRREDAEMPDFCGSTGPASTSTSDIVNKNSVQRVAAGQSNRIPALCLPAAGPSNRNSTQRLPVSVQSHTSSLIQRGPTTEPGKGTSVKRPTNVHSYPISAARTTRPSTASASGPSNASSSQRIKLNGPYFTTSGGGPLSGPFYGNSPHDGSTGTSSSKTKGQRNPATGQVYNGNAPRGQTASSINRTPCSSMVAPPEAKSVLPTSSNDATRHNPDLRSSSPQLDDESQETTPPDMRSMERAPLPENSVLALWRKMQMEKRQIDPNSAQHLTPYGSPESTPPDSPSRSQMSPTSLREPQPTNARAPQLPVATIQSQRQSTQKTTIPGVSAAKSQELQARSHPLDSNQSSVRQKPGSALTGRPAQLTLARAPHLPVSTIQQEVSRMSNGSKTILYPVARKQSIYQVVVNDTAVPIRQPKAPVNVSQITVESRTPTLEMSRGEQARHRFLPTNRNPNLNSKPVKKMRMANTPATSAAGMRIKTKTPVLEPIKYKMKEEPAPEQNDHSLIPWLQPGATTEDDDSDEDRASVRTLDEDNTHMWCFICNDNLENEDVQKGICSTCPRVFHKSCVFPKLPAGNWSDFDFQCVGCQSIPEETEKYKIGVALTTRERIICAKILFACFESRKSFNLLLAVPLNVSGYKKLVRVPLGFKDVAERLEPRHHMAIKSYGAFLASMNRVFHNCNMFNTAKRDDQGFNNGKRVWRLYKKAVSKYIPFFSLNIPDYVPYVPKKRLPKLPELTAPAAPSKSSRKRTNDAGSGSGGSVLKKPKDEVEEDPVVMLD